MACDPGLIMNVGARRPRPEELLATIRLVARETERVIFTDHAQERMEERDLTDLDVFRAIERGAIKGDIRRGERHEEWICKITNDLRGSRHIGVVLSVRSRRLVIITVEWEDL